MNFYFLWFLNKQVWENHIVLESYFKTNVAER